MSAPPRANIFGALDSAVANEYPEIMTWTPEQIALDMIAYDYECEGATPEELIPHIEAWLKWRAPRTQEDSRG